MGVTCGCFTKTCKIKKCAKKISCYGRNHVLNNSTFLRGRVSARCTAGLGGEKGEKKKLLTRSTFLGSYRNYISNQARHISIYYNKYQQNLINIYILLCYMVRSISILIL